MAVTVKKAVLWRRDLENRPGTLADALKPLADAKINLQVVMGYRLPTEHNKSVLELYPVSGGKAETAAKQAGLAPASGIHCLVVEGDDSVGLGHKMASALAQAGINITFAIVQVTGRRFSGVFGFDTEDGANKASGILKAAARVAAPRRKRATAKAAPKKAARKARPTKKAAGKKGVAKKAAKPRKPAKKSAAKAKAAVGKKRAAKKKTGGKRK